MCSKKTKCTCKQVTEGVDFKKLEPRSGNYSFNSLSKLSDMSNVTKITKQVFDGLLKKLKSTGSDVFSDDKENFYTIFAYGDNFNLVKLKESINEAKFKYPEKINVTKTIRVFDVVIPSGEYFLVNKRMNGAMYQQGYSHKVFFYQDDLEKYLKDKTVVVESITEGFSSAQINHLKKGYETINKIDPSSPTYKKLTDMLDNLNSRDLKQLANSKIKWVSVLAQNRVNRKKNESVNLNELDKGDILQHKHNSNISIELIDTTKRGWKVKETTKKGNRSKTKTAYYDDQDVKGDKSIYESINESDKSLFEVTKTYNYKIDALNGFFKGEITAKELDKMAKETFKAKIATKQQLKDFLSNTFTQDVMADTHNISKSVLVKKVKELMKLVENKKINESGTPESELSSKLYKKSGGNEIKFYDELEKIHTKIGHPKYMLWISAALKGHNVDMYRNPKIKNPQEAEEFLYNISK